MLFRLMRIVLARSSLVANCLWSIDTHHHSASSSYHVHSCLLSLADWLPQDLRLFAEEAECGVEIWRRYPAWRNGNECVEVAAGESSTVTFPRTWRFKITNNAKSLQRFGNIQETGVLDDATKALLKKPRCGNADPDLNESPRKRRQKRFALGPSKWEKLNLTWK